MQDAVLAFFRNFEQTCNSADPSAAANAFAESFLYADRNAAKIVPRAVISSSVAQRSALVAKAGLGPSVLERIDVHLLDTHYASVATVWRLDPLPGAAGVHPAFLRATYLVEVRDSAVHILAYLSHVGLNEALSQPE